MFTRAPARPPHVSPERTTPCTSKPEPVEARNGAPGTKDAGTPSSGVDDGQAGLSTPDTIESPSPPSSAGADSGAAVDDVGGTDPGRTTNSPDAAQPDSNTAHNGTHNTTRTDTHREVTTDPRHASQRDPIPDRARRAHTITPDSP